MAFATLDQFWTYGLRAASFAQAGRPIASVDPAANVLVLPMHGFALNAEIRFAIGSTSATLPGGLSSSAPFYAIPTGSDLFQVASAPDGPALDLTSAGAGAIQVSASPEPKIMAQLEADTAVMQGALIAFGPIVAPYPLEIVQVNCHLSAFHLCGTFGLVNPLHPVEDAAIITARYSRARAVIEEWRGGRRPAGVVDSSTGTEENAPIGWASPDRGWTNPCGAL